jgi:hypothetical protein
VALVRIAVKQTVSLLSRSARHIEEKTQTYRLLYESLRRLSEMSKNNNPPATATDNTSMTASNMTSGPHPTDSTSSKSIH